ncbi:protein jim lovell isoform X2 [Bacillus rossius redtenbacheri]|uniref:protein jim lovell isoform X2 n=1 Tax=Bacillus rossius redtenbacheri TaxID=93214 RepID=UPI002FDCF5DA
MLLYHFVERIYVAQNWTWMFDCFGLQRCEGRAAMASPHYSLRWNNHQNHILNAFDTLLQNETLVDVTLVCEEASVRAHKVVLSACSPYFQRIFSENPCKHPVIVLKDLRGWEVQAIVDFMYKGEISVIQDQLASLIKAAESLQVRGLAHTEPVVSDKDAPGRCSFSPAPPPPPPLASLEKMGLFPPHPRGSFPHDAPGPPSFSPAHFEPPLKLPQVPHLPHISFGDVFPPPAGELCASPQPRRKQARPRRRSGDLGGVQDLSKTSPSLASSPPADVAENLSMKKPSSANSLAASHHSAPPRTPVSSPHPLPPALLKTESEDPHHLDNSCSDVHLPDRGDRDRDKERMEYCNDSLGLPPPPPDSSLDSSSFPHLPSVSALALTPPHIFSLDSPLGFFPGMEACRNPLLNDLPDIKNENHHVMGKRKMGRPKGQHSAPRGGPPRSWTNAELTEALQHVWNKKMTTSQASRIFGIPYNSLLMYVRGKYGKSLKLEQLKKDCLGAPGGPLDLLGLGPLGPPPANNNNNNNNNNSTKSAPEDLLGPPVSEHDIVTSIASGFNPYSPASFYPDFAASFPVPVSMIHLLPQSEKNRDMYPPVSVPLPLDISLSKDDECKGGGRRSRCDNGSSAEEDVDPVSRSVSARDDAARLVEQNGRN